MYPRPHIFLGLIFALILHFLVPGITWYACLIVFLSSFLIDFDHYVNAVIRTKKIGLIFALRHYYEIGAKLKKQHEKGIRKRGYFQFFHTMEFHALVFIIGIFFSPFIYVFIGMAFHTLLDFVDLSLKDMVYHREFFFFRWMARKLKR